MPFSPARRGCGVVLMCLGQSDDERCAHSALPFSPRDCPVPSPAPSSPLTNNSRLTLLAPPLVSRLHHVNDATFASSKSELTTDTSLRRAPAQRCATGVVQPTDTRFLRLLMMVMMVRYSLSDLCS
jgi:hypothetical protein